MSPEPRELPFVAINACLREDFLQRVLSRVLEVLPDAAEPCAPALRAELASLPIAGFREFQRAPRGLQARAAVTRFRGSGEFVGCVLAIWTAAQAPLAAKVEAFLAAHGIPVERIRAEEGQFRDQWSLDEVLRLTDLFCAEHGEAHRDDVSLLLCCLTSRAPVPADAPPEEATAATDRPAGAEAKASPSGDPGASGKEPPARQASPAPARKPGPSKRAPRAKEK